MTAQEQNKATLQRFIEAVNDHDLYALDALMQPGFVRHSQATAPLEIRSLDAFKAFLRRDQAAFPDAHQEAAMTVAEGDKVAVYMTLTGTQEGPFGPFPATGRRITVPFLGILRFEEGKIAEMWVEWDNLNVLTQLGLFSPPGMGPE
jgi:steroid delta-isomerase-like uncharacterized protein